jgi:hypothetical protein
MKKKIIFISIAGVSILLLVFFIFNRTSVVEEISTRTGVESDISYYLMAEDEEPVIGTIIEYAKEIITTLSSLFGIVMAIREFRKGKKIVA